MIEYDPLNPPPGPKAGKFGVGCVFAFGVLSILCCFVAAYMWTNGDERLAGAIGVASIAIPVTIGFFVAEARHQRSGAFWFVVAAATMSGALAGWAYLERDDFELRQDLIAPGMQVEAANG